MEEMKRDEEQIVEDTDADTTDEMDAAKTDEEQVVEDTDADTRDIDGKIDELSAKLDEIAKTITDAIDNIANVVLRSGAVVNDIADDAVAEDTVEAVYPIDEITVEDMIDEAIESDTDDKE